MPWHSRLNLCLWYQFVSQLLLPIQLPVYGLGKQQRQPKALGMCSCVGRPKGGFWLLASDRLYYGNHLGSESVDGRVSSVHSASQIELIFRNLF